MYQILTLSLLFWVSFITNHFTISLIVLQLPLLKMIYSFHFLFFLWSKRFDTEPFNFSSHIQYKRLNTGSFVLCIVIHHSERLKKIQRKEVWYVAVCMIQPNQYTLTYNIYSRREALPLSTTSPPIVTLRLAFSVWCMETVNKICQLLQNISLLLDLYVRQLLYY